MQSRTHIQIKARSLYLKDAAYVRIISWKETYQALGLDDYLDGFYYDKYQRIKFWKEHINTFHR